MAAPAPPAYGESDEGDFEIHMDKIGRELQCRICMTAYDDAMVTRCDHYFCATCITSSIQHKKQCPLCKAPVTRRELRVDDMRALVNTYRSVLAPCQDEEAASASRCARWRGGTAAAGNGARLPRAAPPAMPPPPPRCAPTSRLRLGKGGGKKAFDVAAETPVKDHKMDHEKEREKERTRAKPRKSGSAPADAEPRRFPGRARSEEAETPRCGIEPFHIAREAVSSYIRRIV